MNDAITGQGPDKTDKMGIGVCVSVCVSEAKWQNTLNDRPTHLLAAISDHQNRTKLSF